MTAPHSLVFIRARNEGIYLPHLIAHYRALGFQKIVLLTHDLTDGSEAFLGALRDAGVIDWENVNLDLNGPLRTIGGALTSLGRKLLREKYSGVEWIFVPDADEYLILPGVSQVDEWLAGFADFDQIMMPCVDLMRREETCRLEDNLPDLGGPWVGDLDPTVKSFRRAFDTFLIEPHYTLDERDRITLPDGKGLSDQVHEALRQSTTVVSKEKAFASDTGAWEAGADRGMLLHYQWRTIEEYVYGRIVRGVAGRNTLKNSALSYLSSLEIAKKASARDTATLLGKKYKKEWAQLKELPGVMPGYRRIRNKFNRQIRRIREGHPVYHFVTQVLDHKLDKSHWVDLAREARERAPDHYLRDGFVQEALIADRFRQADDAIESIFAASGVNGRLVGQEIDLLRRNLDLAKKN